MNIFKLSALVLAFIAIFFLGYWLSRSGKPYNVPLFTLHKLIVLGVLIYLGVNVYQAHQLLPLTPAQIAASALTAVCFVAAIATGGLLSIEKAMPPFVGALHQVLPYLALLSTAATVYLVLMKSSLALTLR